MRGMLACLLLCLLLLAACAEEPAKGFAVLPTPTVPPIEQLSGGLDSLQSYRLRFTLTTENRVGGQPGPQSELQYERLVVAEPAGQQIHWQSEVPGNAAQSRTLSLYEVAGQRYLIEGAQRCVRSAAASEPLDFAALGIRYHPDELLSRIEVAEVVARNVLVEGVLSHHYAVQELTESSAISVSTTGELWVAKEGGYVLRYEGEQRNRATIGSDQTETIRRWRYAIEDINQLPPLELPEGCAP